MKYEVLIELILKFLLILNLFVIKFIYLGFYKEICIIEMIIVVKLFEIIVVVFFGVLREL